MHLSNGERCGQQQLFAIVVKGLKVKSDELSTISALNFQYVR